MLLVDRPNLMLETEHVTKMFVFKLKCYASDLSITRHCRLEAIAFVGFKNIDPSLPLNVLRDCSKYKHARKELTYLCIISLTDRLKFLVSFQPSVRSEVKSPKGKGLGTCWRAQPTAHAQVSQKVTF